MKYSEYKSINDARTAEFNELKKSHNSFLAQVTVTTKPEKVKDRVGELRVFVKKVNTFMSKIAYSSYWGDSERIKACAEMIAHWKITVKVVTGVNL